MKISELIKEFDSVKSESFSRLSPKMKDAIKDMFEFATYRKLSDDKLNSLINLTFFNIFAVL